MDYAKALFVLEVQKMAVSLLKSKMKPGMTPHQQEVWWKAYYDDAVKQVVMEMLGTSQIVDKVIPPGA